MSHHQARVCWQRSPSEAFIDLRYSRAHRWLFDDGAAVAASSSPASVPLPYSKAVNVDPEEALVAAVSSCHMLFFLSFAAEDKFIVDAYDDRATATMARDARGKMSITSIRLAPSIIFLGPKAPLETDVARWHQLAHEDCYLANSVRADIVIAGRWTVAAPTPTQSDAADSEVLHP
jgi:organic hydroperoxide reductase OsmC/OhrA